VIKELSFALEAPLVFRLNSPNLTYKGLKNVGMIHEMGQIIIITEDLTPDQTRAREYFNEDGMPFDLHYTAQKDVK